MLKPQVDKNKHNRYNFIQYAIWNNINIYNIIIRIYKNLNGIDKSRLATNHVHQVSVYKAKEKKSEKFKTSSNMQLRNQKFVNNLTI